jgi:hypothetical protein
VKISLAFVRDIERCVHKMKEEEVLQTLQERSHKKLDAKAECPKQKCSHVIIAILFLKLCSLFVFWGFCWKDMKNDTCHPLFQKTVPLCCSDHKRIISSIHCRSLFDIWHELHSHTYEFESGTFSLFGKPATLGWDNTSTKWTREIYQQLDPKSFINLCKTCTRFIWLLTDKNTFIFYLKKSFRFSWGLE